MHPLPARLLPAPAAGLKDFSSRVYIREFFLEKILHICQPPVVLRWVSAHIGLKDLYFKSFRMVQRPRRTPNVLLQIFYLHKPYFPLRCKAALPHPIARRRARRLRQSLARESQSLGLIFQSLRPYFQSLGAKIQSLRREAEKSEFVKKKSRIGPEATRTLALSGPRRAARHCTRR